MSSKPAKPNVPFAGVIAGVAVLILVAFLVVRSGRHRREPNGLLAATRASASTATNGGTQTAEDGARQANGNALPTCNRGAEPAAMTAYDEWQHTLVDTDFELTKQYDPPGLVSVARAGFDSDNDQDLEVRDFVIHDLAALRKAAAGAGNPVDILAAYRSYGAQNRLFRERKNEFGPNGARAKTAAPGHSEHQLGTTIDFRTEDEDDVDQTWAGTPAGRWMANNAYRFGFVMSYPRHTQKTTCYVYEPWHYRYFGVDLARQIHDSGLTTREYLWDHFA